MHAVLLAPNFVDVLLNTLAAERFVRGALLHDLLDLISHRPALSGARPLVEHLLARVAETAVDEDEFQTAICDIREEITKDLAEDTTLAVGCALPVP